MTFAAVALGITLGLGTAAVTIYNGVLLGALVPLIPLPLAVTATVVALVLLLVSFGRDVLWLERCARGLS